MITFGRFNPSGSSSSAQAGHPRTRAETRQMSGERFASRMSFSLLEQVQSGRNGRAAPPSIMDPAPDRKPHSAPDGGIESQEDRRRREPIPVGTKTARGPGSKIGFR